MACTRSYALGFFYRTVAVMKQKQTPEIETPWLTTEEVSEYRVASDEAREWTVGLWDKSVSSGADAKNQSM